MRSSPTCSRSEGRARAAFVRLAGLACACGIAVLPLPSVAQMGNPGFMAPDTRSGADGLPATDQTNASDILLVQLVGEGGLAEVSLAELARDKAASDAVTGFAERMVTDHGAANDKLAGIAQEAGVAVPDALDAEHATMRDNLEGMDAASFDLAYMRGQVVDHQKTATLLAWEITAGQNAGLQHFAADSLPVVLEHLAMARGIVEELALGGAGPEPRP
jgi:putative membrane protein